MTVQCQAGWNRWQLSSERVYVTTVASNGFCPRLTMLNYIQDGCSFSSLPALQDPSQ